ncbi:YebY family protein [Proteus mirabilis]|uniref:YebY family protein n=1 Tax=Proteus mirabilis TaxID=584 RepID=UPI000538C5EC|nr:YebY family protein [Proteus mirabilis]EJD6085133.1 YebY family protein [Proteus mirabilis]ELA6788848.1 YebY family protein [Proteus mirabilis]ELB1539009.1 YebY family protein [Proteus mirabilis]ELT8661517.1 YebY family protein [Proteus mirabilis]EMD9368364.1 YebY family protein [Proteus mirabilis]
MKRFLFAGILMLFSFQTFSAPISTVSKLQFGDAWPFTREEVMLNCRADGAWFVINPATLAQYSLNNIAMEQMKSGKVNAQLIDSILLPDPNTPDKKKSLEAIESAFLSLCEKN